MGDLRGLERAVGDGVVVVLARDLDRAGLGPLNRVIPAVVAKRQLVGRGPQCGRQQLVAQADTEDGNLTEQLADGLRGAGHSRRVAGPVGQEDTVWLSSEDSGGRSARGNDFDGRELTQMTQDRRLDTQVVGHDAARTVAHDIRLGGRHLRGQITALRAGLGRRRSLEIGL